jgi:hypothetical protein
MQKKSLISLLLTISSLCLFASAAAMAGDGEDAQPIDSRITAVSLFKNGLGFISREADLPRGRSAVRIEMAAAPVHGTFWIQVVGRDTKVDDIVALQHEETETAPAISLPDLMRANVGAIVDIRVGEKESIRGKILSTPVPAAQEVPASRSASSMAYPARFTPSIALIETDGGKLAVNLSDIRQIRADDLKTTLVVPKRVAVLRMSTENPSGKGRIRIHYLTRGITWAPSSEIDISSPETASVSAKAEIINEAEDLEGAPVSFITGFPNLQFSEVVDPMALSGDLSSFLSSLSRRPSGSQPVVAQQAVLMNVYSPGMEEPTPYDVSPVEGQAEEELFFYRQDAVTLQKGERGYYPLYTLQVPYEHIYEWKIPDTLDEQRSGRYSSGDREEPPKAGDVWHSIRLTNSGGVPWTTAPAMTIQNGHLLGQDTSYYTSPGSKTSVRITRAVDIKAEQAEYEVKRTRNAAQFYGYSYDLVEVQGLLTARSYKNKDLVLSITKDVSGEVAKSVPTAKVEQRAAGLKKVNPHSVLRWEVPLAAGGKAEIEYQYKLYVRE